MRIGEVTITHFADRSSHAWMVILPQELCLNFGDTSCKGPPARRMAQSDHLGESLGRGAARKPDVSFAIWQAL
jgi:hypothetical protein